MLLNIHILTPRHETHGTNEYLSEMNIIICRDDTMLLLVPLPTLISTLMLCALNFGELLCLTEAEAKCEMHREYSSFSYHCKRISADLSIIQSANSSPYDIDGIRVDASTMVITSLLIEASGNHFPSVGFPDATKSPYKINLNSVYYSTVAHLIESLEGEMILAGLYVRN